MPDAGGPEAAADDAVEAEDPSRRRSESEFAGRARQLKGRLEEAAIEAELHTGRREETVAEARAHVAVRLARMTLGSLLLLAGAVMIPLPGPGWLIVAAGLAILARDVAWADRALRFVRRRVPGIPEDGRVPRTTMFAFGAVAVLGVVGSLWWTLR